MKITLWRGLVAPLLVLGLSGVARADTAMLTSAGVTSATTSSCPTTGVGSTCRTGGWFRVAGSAPVAIHVYSTAGSTATVQIRWRAGPSSAVDVLKTITNPAAAEVHYIVDGVGEYQINVSAYTSGTIKATIDATTYSGLRLW